MVRVGLTRKQTTSRPDNVWPDMWKQMSDASKRKATQRWAIEKPKLDNARQLRGTFLIEPNDEEFKLTMNAARRKLDVPREIELSSIIPVPPSNPWTFRKYNQSCFARECTVTTRFYRICSSRQKRKTIEVNSEPGLIPGGVSLRTGRQAEFFTVVNPMDNQDGLGETLCDLSQARIAPHKNTWKHFQDTVFW